MIPSGPDGAQVTATPVGGCLIVTLPAEFAPGMFEEARDRTLRALRVGGLQAVVLDLTPVEIMDREDFGRVRQLADMAALLGVRPMLVGLRAGVVMHLVESDVDTDGLETARDLQEALDRVSGSRAGREPAVAEALVADGSSGPDGVGPRGEA